MKNFIKTLLFIVSISLSTASNGQEPTKPEPVPHFNKIVISPRVNVILIKGEQESVSFIYNDIPQKKVNLVVKGNKMRIFLDDARITERQVRHYDNRNSGKHGIYHGSSITAYVTYRDIKSIEIRGEGEVRCDSLLSAEKFKLRAYGENEIQLSSLNTTKFKASLYGENKLKILGGMTTHQTYRLFGENRIDTRGFKSEVASTRVYGEGRIFVSASDQVRITAIGEPVINIEGTSIVSKGIVVGRPSISVNR